MLIFATPNSEISFSKTFTIVIIICAILICSIAFPLLTSQMGPIPFGKNPTILNQST